MRLTTQTEGWAKQLSPRTRKVKLQSRQGQIHSRDFKLHFREVKLQSHDFKLHSRGQLEGSGGLRAQSFLNQASVFLNQFLLTVAGKTDSHLDLIAPALPAQNEPPTVFGMADVGAGKEVRSGLVSGRRLT